MTEASFFAEKDDVVKIIDVISASNEDPNILNWKTTYLTKIDWLNLTLSKYQEQPLLLNPHLPDLTSTMTMRMKDILFIPNYSSLEDLSNFHEVSPLIPVYMYIDSNHSPCLDDLVK
jgi:hypothetical protein